MTNSTPRLRFAFDLGTNSIGWAVYAVGKPPAGEPQKLLGLGSVIFSDGREPKRFTTLKSQRGAARRSGRRFQRRSRQLHALARELHRLDLLPPRDNYLRRGETIDEVHELRARAAQGPVSGHELGRVLMHIAKHRGYRSNRRWQDNKEDGEKIGQGISKLRESLQERDITLGQHLAARLSEGLQARFRDLAEAYPSRDMVEGEFHRIRECQQGHHAKLDSAAWENLHRLIFFQRPLKAPQPGRCRFVDEPRAPLCLPSVQRTRYFETLYNLRLTDRRDSGTTQRVRLDRAQIEAAVAVLEREEDSSLAAIRKAVGAAKDQRFTVELGEKPRKSLPGNRTAVHMRELLGERWDALPEAGQDELVEALISDDEKTADERLASLGLSDADRRRLFDRAALEPGYHSFGRTVIRAVLERMRDGMDLYDALRDAGFEDRERPTKLDRLPYYGEVIGGFTAPVTSAAAIEIERRFGRIPNDTVHICLNQLRHLFNALCDAYGTPAEVNIETTRSLNAGEEKRREIRKQQEENEDRNRLLDEEIKEIIGEANWRRGDRSGLRRRLRLYQRQNGVCLYSGKPISRAAALDGSVTDIDHVLPWSKTQDDSFDNVVLVFAAENRARKQADTPWQAFPEDKREAILDRARELREKGLISRELMRRLGPEGPTFLENRDWLARQLNETGYVSRVARLYLGCVVPMKDIRFVPGRATAQLRHSLGLSKSREDHRHHALDAAVLGLLSLAKLQAIQRTASRGQVLTNVIEPWEGFADELNERLDEVVTFHRPEHRQYRSLDPAATQTAGALHDENPVPFAAEGGKRIVEIDGNGQPRLCDGFRNTHRLIRHQRADGQVLWKAVRGNANAYIEIYRRSDGRLGGEVVSVFDATRPVDGPNGRKRPYQPAWVREHKNARLQMRLFPGDMVTSEGPEGRAYWVLRSIRNKATGPILELIEINCACPAKLLEKKRDPRLKMMSVRQVSETRLRPVHIDRVGRRAGALIQDRR